MPTCILAPVALLLSLSVFSQEIPTAHFCSGAKSKTYSKTTVADVAEDNYDVKYVKLNLAVNNTSTHIGGDVITKAMVTAPSLSAYVFELDTLLTIDSVLINGVSRSFTTSGVVRSASIPTPLANGAMFTAHVFYNGTAASGSLSTLPAGMNCIASPSWGNSVTFTLSESYHANQWWPCKQSLRDKIDSVDVWLTVPDSLKAGSNGKLMDTTRVDATHLRFEWKEKHPIDYYLISLAVANYIDYSYYMHFTGSSDSMLIQNYIYNNSATLPYFRSIIDSTGLMVDFFSSLYGRYPFWDEKYGHCMAPLGGGMEHQTMTTLGYFQSTIVAHELGHQWFGDHVTCGTWADIFNNEGFASYSEYLFIDHFWNHAAALRNISAQQTNVKTMPDGAVYVDDTTNEGRIFDSRLSYDKGACLLHMLRFVLNDDSAFFNSLRAYQSQQRDSTGTIDDFKHVVVSLAGLTVGGMDLDTFFNEWAYKEGYPIYDVRWNQSGNDVYLLLGQTTSKPISIGLFTTPMEVLLHSATGDTTIRIFNNQLSQLYHFNWGKTILSIKVDPNFWLIYKLSSIVHDTALDVRQVALPKLQISPNPTATAWQVDGLPEGCRLVLTDLAGRVLYDYEAHGASVRIPAEKLATGVYVLKAVTGNGVVSYKLVKGD
jgi:aminopeptidase N